LDKVKNVTNILIFFSVISKINKVMSSRDSNPRPSDPTLKNNVSDATQRRKANGRNTSKKKKSTKKRSK
jgi:hypothetical protein